MTFLRQAGLVLAVFAAVSAVAVAAGADGLGIALAFGQLGFVAAIVYVLLRR